MVQSKRINEAIVLAGGTGTRLQSVVKEIPKPMASINDTPFLEYQFNYLLKQEIKRVVLSVGYKYEVIQSYFGTSYKGIDIDYAIEDEPLGTGGALKLAFGKINAKDAYILNGDTFFSVDLFKMGTFHEEQNADVTMAIKRMENFDRYGVVEFNSSSGELVQFKEKQFVREGYINGGVYLIKRSVFEGDGLMEKFSFEKDILETQIGVLKILAFEHSADQYFIDIGIPEDYQKAQYELEGITN